MATSNALFFTVRSTPPAPQTGWVVKVRHNNDFSNIVAVINEFSALSTTKELNSAGAGSSGTGAGSITLDADDPFWTTKLTTGEKATVLRDREYLFEAWLDGVCRGQWLGRNVEEHLITDDETRAVTISGPGPADVLTWVKVMPPGYPKPTANVSYPSWPWITDLKRPAMSIWLWFLSQAKTRGGAKWVTPTFTASKDSGGVTWADVSHPYTRPGNSPYQPDLGATLLDTLNTLTGQDYDEAAGMRAEWIMHPGFRLDVRPTIGVHREGKVIFYESDTVIDNDRTRSREDLANVIVVRDSVGVMSIATDSESVRIWNRREQFVDQGNLVDKPRRDQVAQIMLQQRRNENAEWTITVAPDDPGRRVYRDYDVGDWIGIQRLQPDKTVTIEAYRVVAITANVDANGLTTLELTLQTKLDALIKRLEAQMTAVKNRLNNQPVTLPVGGNTKQVPVWDPTTGKYVLVDPSTLGGGGGGGGGVQVFIQHTDPGSAASTGDFWYQT